MKRGKAALLGLAGALALLLVAAGCSLLPREETGNGAGWAIRLRIQSPAAAMGIAVQDFTVTALNIQVRDPAGELIQSIDWAASEGAKDYVVPVSQPGQYGLEVTHFGQSDGEQVQATESAVVNIRAMVITVIDILPGGIGLIHVEGEGGQSEVDLTGYWDAILTPPGGEPDPPHLLYLKQTDSSLDISDGLTGTVDVEAMAVTIFIPDFEATLVGTIGPDDTITGTLEMMGQIVGAELRRSVLDFGAFTLSGLIDLNTTDRGLGSMREDQLSYRLDFDVRTSALQGRITFWSDAFLPPGSYAVVSGWDSDFESGEVGASWFFPDYEGEFSAESGTLTLTRNDSTGVSGSFDVQFEGGNSLNGSFELNPPMQGGGLVTIDGGYWDGAEVTPETASGINWSSELQMDWGGCSINFLDEERRVWLDLAPSSGAFTTGTYLVPDQLRVSAGKRHDDGAEFEAEAESGVLVITRFEEGVGVAGYFEDMGFPGATLSGSFDVSFELDDYR